MIAGILTTAWSLSVTTYHLVSHSFLLTKLKAELETAIPNPWIIGTLSKLEQLPYLTACVQEGLRLSRGVSSRLKQIGLDEDLVFNDGKKNWIILRGTTASMTGTLIHHSPEIFPDPTTFRSKR